MLVIYLHLLEYHSFICHMKVFIKLRSIMMAELLYLIRNRNCFWFCRYHWEETVDISDIAIFYTKDTEIDIKISNLAFMAPMPELGLIMYFAVLQHHLMHITNFSQKRKYIHWMSFSVTVQVHEFITDILSYVVWLLQKECLIRCINIYLGEFSIIT